MNNLLQLKGIFVQTSKKGGWSLPNIPHGRYVEATHLLKLKQDLVKLKSFWLSEKFLTGALISVYYNRILAKSNRIKSLLAKNSKITSSSSIVGARFSSDESPKHIITHYVTIELIELSIKKLELCIKILNDEFNGVISHEDIEKLKTDKIKLKSKVIEKKEFILVIRDSFYVNKFDVLIDDINLNEDSIITIYNTNNKTIELMNKIGINILFNRVIGDNSVLLRPDEINLLKLKAPYLISMAVSDITKLVKTDFLHIEDSQMQIPDVGNQPTIGVIDTMFDESVYFSKWVEFKNMVSKDIMLSPDDYRHGTSVTSIIVDGPSLNPKLDDGCGRFKVRHFGVASGNRFSSFTILRNIKQIIETNKDIKVWNLSLGSRLQINPNFISVEAAILDNIQYENNVIFVIAGTNGVKNNNNVSFIGPPADSINSLVVNSVNFNNEPASYTRKGPVLSFFIKPDVSYYGGDANDYIRVCSSTGEALASGTSYAAPWIARKMSYLIDVLGLTKEIAKALIINSATTWDHSSIDVSLMGHGVVPVKIDDIVNSPSDEIRFVISGVSEKYNTYNYSLPVPTNRGMYPYIAKATLCYFPYCSRNQGVDYTNTELEIKFGRINGKDIKSIDDNYKKTINEVDSRSDFRKWDNVKHISEKTKKFGRPKKDYGTGLWGIRLTCMERLEQKHGVGLRFGIVITLKEIGGVNRIDDFIHACFLKGWLVSSVNVINKINIYNIAEEKIDFYD